MDHHDHGCQFKIRLFIGKISLTFTTHLDALAAEGPGHIPDRSGLTLLLVHPRVSLVLVDTGLGFSKVPQYRRVGIARISHDMVNEYIINWM